jgi:hypothetical protein
MSIRERAHRAPRLFHDERLVEAGNNRIRLAIDFLALDAIMEGMAAAATRKLDLCIVTAWHTAVFALSGYSGKLKPLSEFLSSKPEPEETDERMQNAQAIHFFQSLKARGVPIEISRTTH